jgi:hypothetical protein
MAKRSKTSTLNFINMMKEVKITQNSVIEMQGENPLYFWLILEGEVGLYIKPDLLYDENGKIKQTSKVPLF